MMGRNVKTSHANFVQTTMANGLTISTCLTCSTIIASPTSASLRMAEENHVCPLRFPAGKSKADPLRRAG
jgi:ribosomal protein S27E